MSSKQRLTDMPSLFVPWYSSRTSLTSRSSTPSPSSSPCGPPAPSPTPPPLAASPPPPGTTARTSAAPPPPGPRALSPTSLTPSPPACSAPSVSPTRTTAPLSARAPLAPSALAKFAVADHDRMAMFIRNKGRTPVQHVRSVPMVLPTPIPLFSVPPCLDMSQLWSALSHVCAALYLQERFLSITFSV